MLGIKLVSNPFLTIVTTALNVAAEEGRSLGDEANQVQTMLRSMEILAESSESAAEAAKEG